MNPKFSIVIPTCNRIEALEKCLGKLMPYQQNGESGEFEIIVSDDGKESSEKFIHTKFPLVKWKEGPRKGPAANRNNGAKNASGEWLIFLDDDCIPDDNLVKKYEESLLAHKDSKVFEGKIYVDVPRYSLGMISPVNIEGGYLWACNFMIQKELFFSLKGFDEQFPYPAMEDVDLHRRIILAGEKICFAAAAAVCHPWRNKGGWSKVMQHNFSTKIYLSKHPEERSRINSGYYLKLVTRTFVKDTLPGIFKFKGRGLWKDLTEKTGFLYMAFQLLFNKQPEK